MRPHQLQNKHNLVSCLAPFVAIRWNLHSIHIAFNSKLPNKLSCCFGWQKNAFLLASSFFLTFLWLQKKSDLILYPFRLVPGKNGLVWIEPLFCSVLSCLTSLQGSGMLDPELLLWLMVQFQSSVKRYFPFPLLCLICAADTFSVYVPSLYT